MKNWEYKYVGAQTNTQMLENLNSLGKEGWRLAFVTADGLFAMERKIPEPRESKPPVISPTAIAQYDQEGAY